MKHNTSSSSQICSSLPSLFDDKELDVANTLLTFEISESSFKIPIDESNSINESSESQLQKNVDWATKRRKIAIDLDPSPSPSPPQRMCQAEMTTKRRPEAKVDNSRPMTPLALSLSEFDDDNKSKQFLKKVPNKKKTREEWLDIIDRLTQKREVLKGVIKDVQRYYNELRIYNLELMAKLQELQISKPRLLSSNTQLKNLKIEMSNSLNVEKELSQPMLQSIQVENQDDPQIHYMVHQQFSFANETRTHGSQTSEKFQHPSSGSGSGSGKVNQINPIGDLDINMVAEQTSGMGFPQPLNHPNKAEVAKARRRMARMKEIKNSSPFSTKTSRCT